MLPLTITDNYILITSDEEIKMDDHYVDDTNMVRVAITEAESYWTHRKKYKKVIAHLPLNNAPKLEGVTLLPPLPSGEDDVEKMAEQYADYSNDYIPASFGNKFNETSKRDFIAGWEKHSEKYRFTEEDMMKAFEYGKTLKGYDWIGDLIESLSQPKMPTHFKVEMEQKYNEVGCDSFEFDQNSTIPPPTPKIINGVMQGEWIY